MTMSFCARLGICQNPATIHCLVRQQQNSYNAGRYEVCGGACAVAFEV